MQYPIKIPTQADLFRAKVYTLLKRPYLVTGLMCYGFIMLLVIAYLIKAPSFKSEMDLVLPGTGASSNVTLDEVGQVVSQTGTPFAGGFNPRVNYKEMLTSRGVLQRAADKLNMSLTELGVPKVKLTEQTSILAIAVKGSSSEQAQNKAWALYQSLQDELDHLRADEVARRDQSIKNVLQQYRERTNLARSNIVDFQQRALLVSETQVEQLVTTLSQVNERKLYAHSELEKLEDYIQQMSLNLQVSPEVAGKALILKSDPVFRSYYRELDLSTGTLSEYQAKWGSKHPRVVAEQKRMELAKASLRSRGEELTGISHTNLFFAIQLEHNPKRTELFAELIEAVADREGQKSLLADLSLTATRLGDKLKVYSREVAELNRLQREFDLAEAVFTSAAARLEANKADVFASYPVIQMLTPPSLPVKANSPNTLIAIVASVFGFIFITAGLLLVCKRHAIIQLMLKKS